MAGSPSGWMLGYSAMNALQNLVRPQKYPRSAGYDPAWLVGLDMGPSPLPFAAGSFDGVVSIDAYEYFGTADGYLAYITRFLEPGGQLAIATPGMTREVRDLGGIPPHIKACVGWEAIAWHTAAWWRFHWEITDLVTVTSARLQPDGCHDWLLWARACHEQQPEDARAATESVITMLEADGGEFLSFALVAARKTRR